MLRAFYSCIPHRRLRSSSNFHELLSNPLARHASPDSSHKCGRILITVCLSWNGKALLTSLNLRLLCRFMESCAIHSSSTIVLGLPEKQSGLRRGYDWAKSQGFHGHLPPLTPLVSTIQMTWPGVGGSCQWRRQLDLSKQVIAYKVRHICHDWRSGHDTYGRMGRNGRTR